MLYCLVLLDIQNTITILQPKYVQNKDCYVYESLGLFCNVRPVKAYEH